MQTSGSHSERLPARWQALPALDRRVLGVLVEKAKTTPDAYPMSLNALRAGCNQKSNRDPLMEVEEDDVQEALDRLRALGAVAEVQGSGRVPRYRHFLYEWMGVEKAESAVMTELLLRGAQTEGELRGRVARMEPIADLPALRGVLDSLTAKGLVISLSPEGRGHVVTHALYPVRELERLKADFQRVHGTDLQSVAETHAPNRAEHRPEAHSPAPVAAAPEVASLRREMAELASLAAGLRDELADLRTRCEAQQRELDDLRRALGG